MFLSVGVQRLFCIPVLILAPSLLHSLCPSLFYKLLLSSKAFCLWSAGLCVRLSCGICVYCTCPFTKIGVYCRGVKRGGNESQSSLNNQNKQKFKIKQINNNLKTPNGKKKTNTKGPLTTNFLISKIFRWLIKVYPLFAHDLLLLQVKRRNEAMLLDMLYWFWGSRLIWKGFCCKVQAQLPRTPPECLSA